MKNNLKLVINNIYSERKPQYFFEKNEPAAFSNPIYAKISDWIMFKDILLGRLSIW